MSFQKKDETNFELCMGISYEIEVATIAQDETTFSQIITKLVVQ